MNAFDGWMPALALGAVLLAAPAGAQRIAIAPAVQADQAASVDAYLRQTTDALMAQVRVVTDPGRTVEDRTVREPCDRKAQPPEMGVARMRPEAILTSALWRIRARQTIRALEQPLPVCFPTNGDEPDRAYRNVIRFNSEWMAGRDVRYMLCGYAHPAEASAALGGERAQRVRNSSGANLQRRLAPLDAGTSTGDARWVRYHLPIQASAGGNSAAAQRDRCRAARLRDEEI